MKKSIFLITVLSLFVILFFTGCPGSFGPTLDIEFQKLNREPGEPIVIKAFPDGFTPTGSKDYTWNVSYKKSGDIGYTDLNVYQPFEDDKALIYIPPESNKIKVEVEVYITYEGKSKLVSDMELLFPSNKKDLLVEVFDPQGNFTSPDQWFKNENFKSDRTPAYFRYIPDFNPSVVIDTEPYTERINSIELSPNSTNVIFPDGEIYCNANYNFTESEFSYSYFSNFFNTTSVTNRWNITISKNNPLEDWRAKSWHVEVYGQPDKNNNEAYIFRAQKENSSDFVVTDIIDITNKLPNAVEEYEPSVVTSISFDIAENELTELSGKELWGENSYFGIILTEGSTLKGVEMVFSPDINY
ncbi:MAG: hypothetical protein FXF54_03745 [Kosmotoga sp.]|nr:MAG: hypothetical protein FXF54_03745 [Kosmotoga sp.]